MNREQAKNLIIETFENPFDKGNFDDFINNLLKNFDRSKALEPRGGIQVITQRYLDFIGSWLRFFLKGVIEVSKEATETARKIMLLREKHRLAITEKMGRSAGNGHKVLENLFDHPILSVKEIQKITATTFAAANTLVNKFVELGILSEATGYSRNRRFINKSYIDLFSEGENE